MSGGRSSLAQLSRVAALHRPGPRAGQVHQIPLASIDPDPGQPRRDFAGASPAPGAEKRLQGLAANIKALGVEQPLRVRPHPQIAGRFVVVTGERRYRAAAAAGFDTVPCLIDAPDAAGDEATLLVRQLSENSQREPLSLFDEARTVRRVVRELEVSAADLSRLLGRSKTWVSNRLRLLESTAPETTQALERGLLGDVETARRFDGLSEPVRRRLLASAAEAERPIRRAEVDREVEPRRGSPAADPAPGSRGSVQAASPRTVPKPPYLGPPPVEVQTSESPASASSSAEPSAPPAASPPTDRDSRFTSFRLELTADELARLLSALGLEPASEPKARPDQLYAALRGPKKGGTTKHATP